MSKSLGNAIFLGDSAADIRKKCGKIFTGRQQPTDPGDTGNALFQYARAFVKDPARLAELEQLYAAGQIGDGAVKQEVAAAIDGFLAPVRERRAALDGAAGDARVLELVRAHTARANRIAEETLYLAKQAMQLDVGRRSLGPA
jgi:tryptophanyl-tRNA synthetase